MRDPRCTPPGRTTADRADAPPSAEIAASDSAGSSDRPASTSSGMRRTTPSYGSASTAVCAIPRAPSATVGDGSDTRSAVTTPRRTLRPTRTVSTSSTLPACAMAAPSASSPAASGAKSTSTAITAAPAPAKSPRSSRAWMSRGQGHCSPTSIIDCSSIATTTTSGAADPRGCAESAARSWSPTKASLSRPPHVRAPVPAARSAHTEHPRATSNRPDRTDGTEWTAQPLPRSGSLGQLASLPHPPFAQPRATLGVGLVA